jgi:DNA-binding NarL/FixJ family response regulator
MKENYSILIVDDHLMIIDGYKTALKFGFSKFSDLTLKVDYSIDFNGAIEKINYSKKNENYDLVVLDLSIPQCHKHKMNTGEDLGKWIRSTSPSTKLLVVTQFDDCIRINNCLNQLHPEGFLIKSEITSSMDLVTAVHRVLIDKLHYGKKVSEILKNRHLFGFHLDNISIQILYEISNGASMKELVDLIPMSKGGIQKRKKQLKEAFKIKNNSDRDLVLKARNTGFI